MAGKQVWLGQEEAERITGDEVPEFEYKGDSVGCCQSIKGSTITLYEMESH